MERIHRKICYIFIVTMLLSNILQSQTWTNHHSMIAYTGFGTDATAQKIKVFNQDTLIGITKKAGVEHYGFSMFQNGNNTEYIALLDSTDIVISDFTLLGDTAYFCGKRLTSQNTYIGVIGRFSVRDFVNTTTFNCQITDINNTEHLIGLVAFYKPSSNLVHLIAIGNDNILSSNPGRIVYIDFQNNSNSISSYLVFFTQQLTIGKEIMQDICLSNHYISVVSLVYPSNTYIIRTFERSNPNTMLSSNVFAFSNNVYFNVASDPFMFPIHITSFAGDKLAICLSATDGQNFFTMVNFGSSNSPNIAYTQTIPHNDKANSPLEMDYSQEMGKILILNEYDFRWQGANHSLCYIDPTLNTPYTTIEDSLTSVNQLNHFCILPHKKYAVVGVRSTSQMLAPHLYAIKEIASGSTNCIDENSITIGNLNLPNGNSVSNLLPNPYTNLNWSSISTTSYLNGINASCAD